MQSMVFRPNTRPEGARFSFAICLKPSSEPEGNSNRKNGKLQLQQPQQHQPPKQCTTRYRRWFC
jgi:hypothetical protein